MGYFTWKYADDRRKKLPYGGYGVVVFPDDSCIVEKAYYGYGIFGFRDAYDLVAEWNRQYLKEIYQRLMAKTEHNNLFTPMDVIEAYQEKGDNAAQEIAKKYVEKRGTHYLKDWKRDIGIDIACWDEDNDALPYPLKIASVMGYTYKELKPSHGTQ